MDKYTETSTVNSPIYMSYETLRSAVKSTSPQTLANPGKIYFKDNYLFVVESSEEYIFLISLLRQIQRISVL